MLAACASNAPAPSNQSATTPDGDWLLTFPDLGRPQPTLSVAAQAVSGNAGCNSFSGAVSAAPGAPPFARLAATEMACEPAVMQNEALFFEAMAEARALTVNADTLTLTDRAGETVLQFARIRSAPEIAGVEWVMTGPAWNAEAPSLRIDAEGRAGGSTGCNRWFSDTLREGDQLSFTGVGQTKMACPGARGQTEFAFLAALSRVARYRLDGKVLILSDINGQEVARFSAPR